MIKKNYRYYKKKISQFLEPSVKKGSVVVAINQRPKSGPWGGGNHFLNQMISYLNDNGIEVRFSLKPGVKAIFVVTGREDLNPEFTSDEIKEFKKKYPEVKCLHRVNECDLRKNTTYVDKSLENFDQVSDITVFISEWLKDYFKEKWLNFPKNISVIYNGADSSIFYPGKQKAPIKDETWKIVTHHWSSNPHKGWYLYKEVDDMIASGELKGVELTVIGNWPENIKWNTAKALPPLHGRELAKELRKNHIYLTASLWEPCGYHHVEGAQCGLPVVYHADGGGIVEAGKKYGLEFRDDVASAIREAIDNYDELHSKVLNSLPSSKEMCRRYTELLFSEIKDLNWKYQASGN